MNFIYVSFFYYPNRCFIGEPYPEFEASIELCDSS